MASPLCVNSRVGQLVSALKACSRSKHLLKGKKLHQHSIDCGLDHNVYVAAILVTMYSACGDMSQAQSAFDKLQGKDVVLWTALLFGYAENQQGELALAIFSNMRASGVEPDGRAYVAALKACAATREDGRLANGRVVKVKSLENVMQVQSLAGGFRDVFVAGTLVDVYGRCGSMYDARRTFDIMPSYNVVSWNSLLHGYVENGEERLALEMFWCVEEALGRSNPRTFTILLKACTVSASREKLKQVDRGPTVRLEALRQGMMVHAQAVARGCDSELFLANGLVDMYSGCASLVDARRVFDRMPERDIACWNSLMTGYAENGEEELCLSLFSSLLKESGLQPDASSFIAATKACIGLAAREPAEFVLERSSAVEAAVRGACYEKNLRVASSLVHMYSKLGSMSDSQRVFDSMVSHDVVSWTALIFGYAENNQEEAALEVYASMQTSGCEPNARSFVAVLKACAGLAARENPQLVDGRLVKLQSLDRAMCFHSQAMTSGYDIRETYVGNMFMDLYWKSGSSGDARRVFDRMEKHDEVSWNILILACAESHEPEVATGLFEQLHSGGGFPPVPGAFVAALKACSSQALKGEEACELGLKRCFWLYSKVLGSESVKTDLQVASVLIDTFAKCGSMETAREVFERMKHKDVVLWTSLISGYVESENGDEAITLYGQMRASDIRPDPACYLAVLRACGISTAVETGRAVRADIYRYVNSDSMLDAGVINMYGRCGDVVSAQEVFDSIARTDPVIWTALVSGYSRQGDAAHALRCLELMVREGIRVDRVTLVCSLAACSHGGEIVQGKKLLNRMLSEFGITPGTEHHICMTDLLGRANEVEEAKEMALLNKGNVVGWRSFLGACSKERDVVHAKLAFQALSTEDPAAYQLMANACS